MCVQSQDVGTLEFGTRRDCGCYLKTRKCDNYGILQGIPFRWNSHCGSTVLRTLRLTRKCLRFHFSLSLLPVNGFVSADEQRGILEWWIYACWPDKVTTYFGGNGFAPSCLLVGRWRRQTGCVDFRILHFFNQPVSENTYMGPISVMTSCLADLFQLLCRKCLRTVHGDPGLAEIHDVAALFPVIGKC